MRYIQLVEFDTNHPVHEVQQALDAWLAASRGKRNLHMAVVAADHDRSNHYWELLEYASEQEAVKRRSYRRPRRPTRSGPAFSTVSRHSTISTSSSTLAPRRARWKV